MNGLTKEATIKRNRYETPEQMIADLRRWFVQYNCCRSHRRNADRTPYEVALSWYETDPTLFIREPTALLAYRS